MAAAKKSSRKKSPRKAAAKRAGPKRKPAKQGAKKPAARGAKGKAAVPSGKSGKPGKAGKPARKAVGTAKQAPAKAPKRAAPKPSAAPAAAMAKPAPAAAKPKAVASLPGPKAGDDAPDFKLLDDAGRTQSLGNFRGRKVVLYFYPKDFTGGCTQQACDFRDSFSRLAEKGATVLGVSADSVDSHKRFKEKQGLNYLLLSDPGHEAIGSYGVWQEKSLYGRKFMGIVRSTFLIDEQGKIAKAFPKVKVGGHVDEVLASL